MGFGRSPPGRQDPSASPSERRGSAIGVTVAPVTVRRVVRTVEVVGTFSGYEEVTIAAKVSGPALRVFHDVGDLVRPGEVLVEIDPTDHQLDVLQARRALEADLAKLGVTAMPGPDFDVQQLPSVVRATKVEENAWRRYERAERLRNTLSQDEVEQLATDYQVAKAARQQAILDAQGTLASARLKQVTLQIAEQRLKDTKVVVPTPTNLPAVPGEPIEYVVAQRKIAEGEMVKDSPGSSANVFELVLDKILKFQGAVPERYGSQVKVGQKVEMRVEAYPDQVFQGTISRLNPTVDRASRTFQIEALVSNPQRLLKPGGFAKAAILTQVDPSAKTVPVSALVSFAGTTKVFAVQDGVARAVAVEPGLNIDVPTDPHDRRWVEVRGELAPGTPVVTSGFDKLADGMAVAIRQVEPVSPVEPAAK